MGDDYWVEDDSNWTPSFSKKRKRKVGKRKIEYVGWGSRPLIEFLEAIGQDTSRKHSQHEVTAFITKYINGKGLSCPQKKKKVLCDERLFAIFGKKSVIRTKVHDLLEDHFAENVDDSDGELLDSSDEENDKGKNSVSKSNSAGPIKKLRETPKSCFAAITPENIKLVFLKKSLIQELHQDPESFESKIVGSFVRMRSDPYDIYQKNRFQLQLVTGLGKLSEDGDAATEVRLRVANFHKDVALSMLSDDNFAEEEIEDVRDRIKAGLLKRLTVIDLEAKAKMLHTDITKHGIEKELSLLQKLIDRANEKGWRRELFDYLDRRKLLQTPSEVEKLLLKVPEVIAEELEIAGGSEKAEGSGRSPKSILRGSSDVSSTDASGSGDHVTPSQVTFDESHAFSERHGCIVSDVLLVENANGVDDALCTWRDDASETSKQVKEMEYEPSDIIGQGSQTSKIIGNRSNEEMQDMNSKVQDPEAKHVQQSAIRHVTESRKQSNALQVIELSDDESEAEETNEKDEVADGECPEAVEWHYLDPQGLVQGPFSLFSLKRWSDSNYFSPEFKVWRNGQSVDDAVLLIDVLAQTFP